MSITYNHEIVHTGAETVTNQLNGTAVQQAGKGRRVAAAFVSSDGTNTATLRSKRTGTYVIPAGSHACQMTLADMGQGLGQQYIYEAIIEADDELDLEVIAAGASTSLVSVRID